MCVCVCVCVCLFSQNYVANIMGKKWGTRTHTHTAAAARSYDMIVMFLICANLVLSLHGVFSLGLEIFFPARYGLRFFKNHSFQKVVTKFLINPPILHCQKA